MFRRHLMFAFAQPTFQIGQIIRVDDFLLNLFSKPFREGLGKSLEARRNRDLPLRQKRTITSTVSRIISKVARESVIGVEVLFFVFLNIGIQ